MTDLAVSRPVTAKPALDVSSDAAKARIRARYRAERRFRFYGIAALVVTTLFLAMLLVDIVSKGLPVFKAHSLVLDVAVTQDAIDPAGKRDAATIRAADLAPVMRDALKSAVPGPLGRLGDRTLVRLLSIGAADDLVADLLRNPALIGSTIRTRLLLSDDADIYLKAKGAVTSRRGDGTITPDAKSGAVAIAASGPAFAVDLARIKAVMVERARVLETEAARLDRSGGAAVSDKVADLRREAAELLGRARDPAGEETLDTRLPSLLLSINGGLVKVEKLKADSAVGTALLPLSAASASSDWSVVTYATPAGDRKITDLEIALLEHLRATGKVEAHFNTRFFTSGDSREPELAGIRGALSGTAWTMLVTLVLCVPIGVLAAIYLEEFAPKNRWTDIVEVNINNLAAVPSIVFGLLGLAVFLNFFDLPRSAPLVGGLVLALLVLPTIIIASRAALKSVPPSIKEAALGVGASHQQAVFHHVLPSAVPGIMTGTIIGMAHALGETAPLLLIGMVAFIVDVPQAITDASTVLPVQVYLWSDLPEPAFQEKTAGAIIVMLMFLFVMNAAAIMLRRRFERRW